MAPKSVFPEGINLDRFKELSDGERDGLLDLIHLYLSKTEEQIQELEKALNNQAGPEIARLAHSMVGANAMVGLDTVVPGLRQLEAHAERKNFPEASRVFQEVHSELKRILAELKKYAQTL